MCIYFVKCHTGSVRVQFSVLICLHDWSASWTKLELGRKFPDFTLRTFTRFKKRRITNNPANIQRLFFKPFAPPAPTNIKDIKYLTALTVFGIKCRYVQLSVHHRALVTSPALSSHTWFFFWCVDAVNLLQIR